MKFIYSMRKKLLENRSVAKTDEDGKVFDLFEDFYHKGRKIVAGTYIVGRKEEGRMDLICQEIYGDVDNIDLLMRFNGIVNEMGVSEGTILTFGEKEFLSTLLNNTDEVNIVRSVLINSAKKNRKDSSRSDFKKPGKDPIPGRIVPPGFKQIEMNDDESLIILAPEFRSSPLVQDSLVVKTQLKEELKSNQKVLKIEKKDQVLRSE